MLSGIINIYKERDWTSSDVVVKLRHMLKIKKIGHTGTLDPAAEGVLPICVGRATQLSDYIMDKTKTYEAELILGKVTDTQDVTGNIIDENDPNVSTEQLAVVLNSFVGEIQQIPPMYSAIKHNGKKLYELARNGITVERTPRTVNIYSVELLHCGTDNRYIIRVKCSKGTYIRTLCHDIGQALGCGACMGRLVRTACDNFVLDKSLTIDEVGELIAKGDFSFISDFEQAVSKFPVVHINKEFAFHFLNGLDADKKRYSSECDIKIGDIVRVHIDGVFCAVALLTCNGLHVKNILVDTQEFIRELNNG